MADVNFKDFLYKPIEEEDFIVGYNADGTAEIRTKIEDVANLLASGGYGATGPIGPAGTIGATGLTGPAGATGLDGGRGATGLGSIGATGPRGATGPQGIPGTNAGPNFVSLTAKDIFTESLNTYTPQTTYEGTKLDITILNNTTSNRNRIGRMSMYNVNYGTNSTLRFVETTANKFKVGDVIGIASRQNSDVSSSTTLRIEFQKLDGSPVFVTDLLGGYGYNEGAVALVYNGDTFDIQNFNQQNIKGIASELRVEAIQANDPGTPFNTLGRGTFVHGLTLNAGDIKFTNGADHFHLIHSGSGDNNSWQTLNGGYTHTPMRITQHTLAPRGGELRFDIVAANTSALTGNHVTPPYGVIPENNNNYMAMWLDGNHPRLAPGNIIYFSVSPGGILTNSLRYIGFTAASYPAKVISNNSIGSANSNADIPAGSTIPANAAVHIRVQPINLQKDNWSGAALIDSNGNFRGSSVPGFSNTLTNNANEIVRIPDTALLVPDLQRGSLSALGGYNNVSMRNGCELVFDLTNTPLLSSRLPFLYEGLPVIVLLSTVSTLTATNYGGLTPNSAKCQYGLELVDGQFTGRPGNYQQQTYDGYIYRSTSAEVIIRLGQNRGTEESRMQKHATPNVEWFVDKPGSGITSASFTKNLPPGGEQQVSLNGYWVEGTGVRSSYTLGTWSDCYLGRAYTMPPVIKSGLEFTSFPPTSSSVLQLFVYAGNKDPVHRPVASMQLFSYERYPNVQPELRESAAIVSKFCLGPSCEGFDRDTSAIGFNSTAYHYRSMAIGHRIETIANQEVAIGIDANVLRITLSGISVSSPLLSSNGVDTYLKIKQDNGTMYGLKLEVI